MRRPGGSGQRMVALIRIGCIGAGFIADYHLAGLAAAGGAEVRVIAARTRTRAEALAARFRVPEVADDWRAVPERPDIDAVLILTPDDTHEAIAIGAAEAGKAILLQKPMAPTAAACRRIIAAARAAGVDLQVSFMHRHFEEVVHVQELLASGRLGAVDAVRIRNATPGADWNDWFFSKERVGGGVVLQLGIHGIDLLRHLFGDIETVRAATTLRRGERTLADGRTVRPDNEDNALALYRLAGDALGTHEMSMSEVAGCDRFRLEIYGEKGTAWLRTERGRLALFAPAVTGERGWFVPQLSEPAMGARQHARWLAGLCGEAPPERTAEDGLAAALVAEAIYRSAASGKEEPVAPLDLPPA